MDFTPDSIFQRRPGLNVLGSDEYNAPYGSQLSLLRVVMDAPTFRRTLYGLLASLSIGITIARILGLEFVYEPSLYHAYPHRLWPAALPKQQATFSSNDRSRWATVRSLVEGGGTFVIGRRVDDPNAKKGYRDEGILFEDGYRSIDVMMNPETKEFFSTKPPLFTLMVAGEYGLLYRFLGWNLDDDPWPVVCTILITFNVLPLLVFLILLARLLEEYGTTDWGRIFVFAVACLGTFLTTFSVTLNNHTPGACCVMFAVYPLLAGRSSGENAPYSLVTLFTAGFFAGLSVCLDLPAAALAGSLGLYLGWTRGRLKPVLVFAPAMLLPIGALLATNYLAIGDWKPAYDKFGTPWYEYEGSHWLKARQDPPPPGIDFAREPKSVYAFHLLLGHHGLFSLTPVWFFALAGMLGTFRRTWPLGRLAALSLLTFMVVVGFYVGKTNNYGGFTSGPRWLFWLTPLFLLAMIPVADRLAGSRTGRTTAYLFLAMSAFSAFYPVSNPWRHPWIYQLCEHYGWIRY